MNNKVLILSTSAGTGHVRSGDALQKAFHANTKVSAVEHVDALVFTNKLFRDFYSKLYSQLVEKAPEFLGWWYKQTDEPWKTDKTRLMLDRLNTQKLVKYIHSFKPDICLCTHFMPAGIISHLIGKGVLQTDLSIVITDYDLHAMWLARNFHRYFVACEEVREHLKELGLPKERISTTGIPIDPVFALAQDKKAIRASLDLPLDRKVLLFNVSALPPEDRKRIISGICSLTQPAHTIVLCGKNPEIKGQLHTQITQAGRTKDFTLVGYTNEMHLWMGASDLYIGKPGGLATAEALALGLPLAIVSPIPGQEERNSDFLLENGAAIKCPNTVTIRYRLEKILNNDCRLDQMSLQSKSIGFPHAAQQVVDILLDDRAKSHHPTVTLNQKK